MESSIDYKLSKEGGGSGHDDILKKFSQQIVLSGTENQAINSLGINSARFTAFKK